MDASRSMRQLAVRVPARFVRGRQNSDEGNRRARTLLIAEAFTVPADPSQATVVRKRLRVALGPDHRCADSAELVASELFANAVIHGCAPGDLVRLTIRRLPRSRVVITVVDTGRGPGTAPHLRLAGTGGTNGRGLFIVASVASRWSVRRAGAGYRVRAFLAPGDAGSATFTGLVLLDDFPE
ncbi:ATP-binding protein [Actinomadura sp. 21ATH]|uniref:ATP-binding protein n=1 Tax=Actinomadura sp. 21ATH TaxID=1735444 RepID=UPI0035BF3D2A